jgi:hypothetical protein
MLRGRAFSCVAAVPFVLMAWRNRSVGKSVFSVLSWCLNTAGLVRGLLERAGSSVT